MPHLTAILIIFPSQINKIHVTNLFYLPQPHISIGGSVTASGVHTPSYEVHAPLREILDPPLISIGKFVITGPCGEGKGGRGFILTEDLFLE